jgi:hypothetical protein
VSKHDRVNVQNVGVPVGCSSGGEALIRFVLDATNHGAIDAGNVDVLLELPIRTAIETMSCLVGGSNCNAMAGPTPIGVCRDIAANGRVSMAGTLRTSASAFCLATLEARAPAPYGFVEVAMKYDARAVQLDEGLLAQGVDSARRGVRVAQYFDRLPRATS